MQLRKCSVLATLLLMLFSFPYSCTPVRVKNSLEVARIKGKVRTITTLQINAAHTEKNITANGSDTSRTIDIVKADTSKYVYEYDSYGNLITQYIYPSTPGLVFEYVNKYVLQSELIESKYFQDGTLKDSNIYQYKYDLRNRKMEKSILFPNGITKSKLTYNYDNKDNETEVTEYSGMDTSYSRKFIYTYDDIGNKDQEAIYKNNGTLLYRTKTTHDANGNPIEEIAYSPVSNITTKTTFKYDNYDKTGNWLKEEVFVNGKLYQTLLRTIEYY